MRGGAGSGNHISPGPDPHAGRNPHLGYCDQPGWKGTPAGEWNAKEGAAIYLQKCAKCHGRDGEQQIMGFSSPNSVLVPRTPNGAPRPPSQPLATIYWDHINRAMPRYEEGSLSANEVYALTALLLYWHGIIQQSDVMDAKSLPKVQMPNQDGFVPAPPDLKQSLSCDPQLLRCVEYWKKLAGKEK